MRTKLKELDHQSLGAVVRELRKNKKMSITEFSERTGICRSYLTMIEQGKANPSIELVMLMFCSLGKKMVFSLRSLPKQQKQSGKVA